MIDQPTANATSTWAPFRRRDSVVLLAVALLCPLGMLVWVHGTWSMADELHYWTGNEAKDRMPRMRRADQSAISNSHNRRPDEIFVVLHKISSVRDYGKSVAHLAAWLAAPLVLTRRVPSPANLIGLLDQAGITHLSLVPYLCSLIARSPRFAADALPGLRRITIAGGAPAPSLLAEIERRFPGRVVPMYGLTEASTRVACMPAAALGARRGSGGRPLAGVEVAVAGERGEHLGPRATGEILMRGPNAMRGYFRDRAATRTVLVDGWLRTGDLGWLDDDGFLHVAGRRKDVVKVMGESVSAASVEAAILALPQVAEVAVTGLPHEAMGEALCAFVRPRAPGADLDPEAIRRHCAAVLGRARVPTHVRLVSELPKTASGKVRKHLLSL